MIIQKGIERIGITRRNLMLISPVDNYQSCFVSTTVPVKDDQTILYPTIVLFLPRILTSSNFLRVSVALWAFFLYLSRTNSNNFSVFG